MSQVDIFSATDRSIVEGAAQCVHEIGSMSNSHFAVEPDYTSIEWNAMWHRTAEAIQMSIGSLDSFVEVPHANAESNQRFYRFVRANLVNRDGIECTYQAFALFIELGEDEMETAEASVGENCQGSCAVFFGRSSNNAVGLVSASRRVIVSKHDRLNRIATLLGTDMKRDGDCTHGANCLRPRGPRGRLHSDPTVHLDHPGDNPMNFSCSA